MSTMSTHTTSQSPLDPARPTTSKVAHVAAAFWVMKLLTTGMGEAMSDWIVNRNEYLGVGLGLLGFLAAITWQVSARRYHALRYWATVAMVAIFGTMAADAVHVVLGVPYLVTTLAYLAAVVVVLLLWHRIEGTISIHSITTRRRELFYWLTVLATFALGTAAGDFSAVTLGLGYLESAGLFALLMVLVLVAWRMRWLGSVAAFWTAYVFTRPLGASIADWLGKPADKGSGPGLGDGVVSLGALVLFGVLLAWLAASHADDPGRRA